MRRHLLGLGLFAASLVLYMAPQVMAEFDRGRIEQAGVQRALLRVARATVGQVLGSSPHVPPNVKVGCRCGCFVTFEVDGRVRGCRGTLTPMTADLGDEIRRNAIAASLHDPLHAPLTAAELERARISITVVCSLASTGSVTGLSVRDGLVIRAGTRVGVVLPYEGSDANVRLEWGLRKAGLRPHDAYEMLRMTAIRFAEEGPVR